jgi:hypothetical protein
MTILDPIAGHLVTIDIQAGRVGKRSTGLEVAMKRSSARRARRWVIQELTRRIDQLSDTAIRAILSGNGNPNRGGEKSSLIRSS